MPEASNEVVIDRPIDEVFAFLADAENDPRWRDGVLDIAREPGASGVGARYRQGIKGPGGRRVAADVEITEYVQDTLIAFRGTAGPVRPEGRYTFSPADGGTRVRFELAAKLGGLKRLMSSPVQKSIDAEVASLAKLKPMLESDQAPGAR
jgi:uncharacterized protein YndB with AHSA1/START domain